MKKDLRIQNHQVIRKKEAKDNFVAPIFGEITLPKESIKTQKVTNVTSLITQSEAPAPK